MTETDFCFVGYDKGVGDIFDLPERFVPPAYFEEKAIIYFEIPDSAVFDAVILLDL